MFGGEPLCASPVDDKREGRTHCPLALNTSCLSWMKLKRDGGTQPVNPPPVSSSAAQTYIPCLAVPFFCRMINSCASPPPQPAAFIQVCFRSTPSTRGPEFLTGKRGGTHSQRLALMAAPHASNREGGTTGVTGQNVNVHSSSSGAQSVSGDPSLSTQRGRRMRPENTNCLNGFTRCFKFVDF